MIFSDKDCTVLKDLLFSPTKTVYESTFIFLDPEKIFELFVLENLKLGHKTLQIYQDLEIKFNKQNFQKLNFNTIPYFDFTEI